MNDDIKRQLCIEDFYVMMASAVMQAGGAEQLSKWKEMKLEELVNILAHNGIRMVYMPEKHMDGISIVWKEPVKQSNIPFSPPNQPYIPNKKIPDLPPKKKQLLCDQFGDVLAEEEGRPTGYGGFY